MGAEYLTQQAQQSPTNRYSSEQPPFGPQNGGANGSAAHYQRQVEVVLSDPTLERDAHWKVFPSQELQEEGMVIV